MRSEVRESFLTALNERLHALAATGADLGVEIERIDLTPSLPPDAKDAFDKVLVATQTADKGVEMARTEGELRRQQANSDADRLISAAQATAAETVSNATVATAGILALVHDEKTSQSRNSLLLREYRARVASITARAHVIWVPPNGPPFYLPGGE